MARPKTQQDLSELETMANPLVNEDFIIHINNKKDFKFKDKLGHPYEYELDNDKFIRVYTTANYRKTVSSLNPGAKSLFLYIMYELDYDRDYIWIDKKTFMRENGIKDDRTFYKAIDDLCLRPKAEQQPIIMKVANAYDNVYWINPRYFFKGCRPDKYPDNVK